MKCLEDQSDSVSDLDDNYIRNAKRTELEPASRLPEIATHDASRSQNPRPQSVSENMMDWLSTSIVHDLRNPVATICAGAEILMNVDSTSSQVKRLAINIYRAAGRMRELLAEISWVTIGNRSIPETCDIRELIAAAAEAASSSSDNGNVRIVLDVPRKIDLPLTRSRMQRVFFNLITNALEAMSDGGEVRIGARKAGTYLLVDIEDTGPGIPCDIRDRIFEPFVTAGKSNGLGLGLALSRRAVLDDGGDIWIEPAPGARFVIRLPLNRDQFSGLTLNACDAR
jgi:signal transduction histidine kinase